MKTYLHQFLSKTGAFRSKKEIVEAVRNKEITIDGRIVSDLFFQLNPKSRIVEWKGRELSGLQKKTYVVINKPKGFLSSKLAGIDAVNGKRSVFELLPKEKFDEKTLNSLFCVGRLDEDSSGLLIMTNDGELGARLTNPDNKVEKCYDVLIDSSLSLLEKERLESGVIIELEENGVVEKYRTKPCKIEIISPNNIKMAIIEGKKREIRRMLKVVRKKVVALQRVSIGKLKLVNLKLGSGEFVVLDKIEV